MSKNYTKLWLQRTLNENAIGRAQQAIRSTGRALPCRVVAVQGALVTVNFEVDTNPWTIPQLTIPKAESPWIRMPTQVGDFGITMPGDTYLGGVSGIGGGVASLTQRGDLSSLVFVPISNKNSPPIDQNAAQVQGPNGAIIRNTQGTETRETINQDGYNLTRGSNSFVLDDSGITLTFGGKVVKLDGSGLTIDGILFDMHTHTYSPGTNSPTETGWPQS